MPCALGAIPPLQAIGWLKKKIQKRKKKKDSCKHSSTKIPFFEASCNIRYFMESFLWKHLLKQNSEMIHFIRSNELEDSRDWVFVHGVCTTKVHQDDIFNIASRYILRRFSWSFVSFFTICCSPLKAKKGAILLSFCYY